MIEDHFNRWKESHYSSRAGSLIGYEEFLEVNKFRDQLQNIGEEKLAFLLRNAVQNGMGGNWGYWLVKNKENEKIIIPLVRALDGTAGWQPTWRAAYILEVTFGRSVDQVFEQLPDEIRKNKNIEFAFHVMSTTGVKEHLQSTETAAQVEAQRVLQEIENFSEQIGEYIKYAPTILKKFKQFIQEANNVD